MKHLTKSIAAAVVALGLVSGGAVAANAATVYTLTYDSYDKCISARANYAAQGYYTTICRTKDLGGGMYKWGFTYTSR